MEFKNVSTKYPNLSDLINKKLNFLAKSNIQQTADSLKPDITAEVDN